MVNSTIAILAAENASSAPLWIQPLTEEIFRVISRVSFFVGGIFGLYLIFLLLQWRERMVINKKLKKIEEDVHSIFKILDVNDDGAAFP
ncbi:MAG TPA: hypothetical protein VI894_03600 [Candidatus Nanoarchaeia archaeon]|nr:hypothetical protein [Candidatus Nanoarchaeia archaeon]